MKFDELQERLKKLGVAISERTLNSWREAGFLTGPKLIEKPRRSRGRPAGKQDEKTPGPSYEWPPETLEEAAAVWALKNSDIYRRRPDPNTILRVKHKAKELHERYTVTLDLKDLPGDEYRKDVTPNGVTGTFFFSYDLHPLLVLWIAAVEKVRHNIPINENRLVTFCWVKEEVQGETKLAFRGVELEESDENELKISLA